MDSPKSEKSECEKWPSRSTSAPLSLDSNMLFAFPVPSHYTSAFSSTPLPHYAKSTSSEELIDEALHLSDIVRTMIDDYILKDDSPKHSDFSTFPSHSLNVAEFTPIGLPFFNIAVQFTPSDIYTHAYEMAKDQLGCRMLQKKLEESNPFSIQTIFDQIQPHLPELMIDPFGNYLMQKLIEVAEESLLAEIVPAVALYLPSISLNPHGTRAVQKLVEVVAAFPDFVPAVVSGISQEILSLIKDINGNHVIQRCVNILKPPQNQFIFEFIGQNIIEIATDRHGCCVLQRCIHAANDLQREALVDKIIEKAVELVQDAYGNYVVQYVLDLNSNRVNSKLAYIFINSLQKLATQKFSSNVIEKCLQQNSEDIQQAMIHEIGKAENIVKMIGDQYANYGIFYIVVQRALTLATPAMLDKMLCLVKPQLEELKNSHFGKKIYMKLLKNYPVLIE